MEISAAIINIIKDKCLALESIGVKPNLLVCDFFTIKQLEINMIQRKSEGGIPKTLKIEEFVLMVIVPILRDGVFYEVYGNEKI